MEAFRDGYDVARPSAFELFAEHQLDGHFKPALAFVVAHYAQRFPRYLIPLLNRIDEVHLLLAAVANAYYLRIWSNVDLGAMSHEQSRGGMHRFQRSANND
ncbi:hypothetical protein CAUPRSCDRAFT_11950 [Caulochytrium protostelioides]|uniref:Peroxin-12 n=1 Tax=Caulochytrium protostelioides TaxID=1555241 RepID=A0A4P9WY03_9FUNG|nr:hypothetical protein CAUPRSCDRAFT_11950 [Caulochytrium protostelioides]